MPGQVIRAVEGLSGPLRNLGPWLSLVPGFRPVTFKFISLRCQPTRANHVAFSVPDLQGFRSYLDGECVAVTASSSNLPQFFVADPSGNVIEFTALAR
jgi:hypothetical protein